MLAFVFVSQPFALFASQLPHPLLHAPSKQTPVEHEAAAFGYEQSMPQPAQSVSVLRLVSQPLFTLPSQLPQPAAHAGTHTPPVHAVVPLAFVQAIPHEPQFAVVVKDVSQPLAMLPSQFA